MITTVSILTLKIGILFSINITESTFLIQRLSLFFHPSHINAPNSGSSDTDTTLAKRNELSRQPRTNEATLSHLEEKTEVG